MGAQQRTPAHLEDKSTCSAVLGRCLWSLSSRGSASSTLQSTILWSSWRLCSGFKTSLWQRESQSSPGTIIPASLAANSGQPCGGLHRTGYSCSQGVSVLIDSWGKSKKFVFFSIGCLQAISMYKTKNTPKTLQHSEVLVTLAHQTQRSDTDCAHSIPARFMPGLAGVRSSLQPRFYKQPTEYSGIFYSMNVFLKYWIDRTLSYQKLPATSESNKESQKAVPALRNKLIT